ncbi:MAG: hypothetical protein ABW067_05170, partial [Rhizobacter sp.]
MARSERSVVVKGMFAAVLVACALSPLARQSAPATATTASPEWPMQWEGKGLRPLALSAVEQRFAARFPGHIARMTDGELVLVLRAVKEPTRQLHPAADCFRGLGYTIRNAQ